MKFAKLTDEQLDALMLVKDGADVYIRPIAGLLRGLEKTGHVEITKPMMYRGDGTDQMPYFGAIATKKGLQALNRRTP